VTQTTAGDACQHYWLIERPQGPTSKGVCRLCSEERDFPNYIAETTNPNRTRRRLEDGVPHTRLANGRMV
jgi:hypothetical protein